MHPLPTAGPRAGANWCVRIDRRSFLWHMGAPALEAPPCQALGLVPAEGRRGKYFGYLVRGRSCGRRAVAIKGPLAQPVSAFLLVVFSLRVLYRPRAAAPISSQ